jgi:hypothetical protein
MGLEVTMFRGQDSGKTIYKQAGKTESASFQSFGVWASGVGKESKAQTFKYIWKVRTWLG